jgi:hypothetical protein
MLRPYDPDETVDLGLDFTPDGRPVPPPAPAMSEGTTRRLANAEYDFCRIDAALSDLRDVLRQAAREAPRCAVAARQVQAARRVLRHALDGLDAEVTAAVQELERLDETPF